MSRLLTDIARQIPDDGGSLHSDLISDIPPFSRAGIGAGAH
jgi:hypothetical protein